MKKEQLREVVRDIKRLWAQSLAQVDNTSGRRGIEMQMEAVEEMCDHRINPAIDALLAGLDEKPAAPASLALPVVSDPRDVPARQKRFKSQASRNRNLSLVA